MSLSRVITRCKNNKVICVLIAIVLAMIVIKLSLVLFAFFFVGKTQGIDVRVTQEVVWEIKHGNQLIGSITIALFGETAPLTVKNFATLSDPKGFNGLSYRGSIFHRVIPRFMIQVCIQTNTCKQNAFNSI